LFGVGFLKTAQDSSILTDICFLASSGQIGIVGCILFLSTYATAFAKSADKRSFLTSNSGFFFTTLFAQPMFYSPVIYMFLFFEYSKNGRVNSQR
jgi:hypothetical protein